MHWNEYHDGPGDCSYSTTVTVIKGIWQRSRGYDLNGNLKDTTMRLSQNQNDGPGLICGVVLLAPGEKISVSNGGWGANGHAILVIADSVSY